MPLSARSCPGRLLHPHRYTTLGYLAGQTSQLKLGTLVTGVHYRHPGLLAKIVTTLDVLSGGRAFLGIGAGWNEAESRGLGVPFPPTRDRFEQLEEAVQICLQMWSGDERPFDGRHYHLERPLNSPQSLNRPRIVIGGSGEQKTLRLVARYADACNLFPTPEIQHKLEVLKGYCEAEGRDYAAIEKTSMLGFDAAGGEQSVQQAIAALRWLADMGIQKVFMGVADVYRLTPLEIIANRIMPAAADI